MGQKDPPSEAAAARRTILGVHPNVFFLGLVSFLTDVSSEMVLNVLPLFLSNVLGVKTTIIGLIEGVGESTASLLRIPSGWLSDRWQRKPLTLMGYGLSTIAKPFFYIASSWGVVAAVRFSDRVGKGLRTAPRDALLADSAAAKARGRSFGLHRALDTYGSVVGLALAALVVFLTQRGSLEISRPTFQWLVLLGIPPAVAGVVLLKLLVKEERRSRAKERASDPNLAKGPVLSRQFQVFLGIIVLFTLGKTGDAFLVLRAQNLGLSVVQILLVLVLFNLVYATVATPAGSLSDRIGRKGVLLMGWVVYALVYLGFAVSSAPWQVLPLYLVYGLYHGATDGVAKALVADVVAAERRGTAYGLYNAAVGLTTLPAALLAGWLWQVFNPAAPFFFGAAVAGLSLVLLASLIKA